MAFNRDANNVVLRPDEFAEVYYQPLINASVAMRVFTGVSTSASKYRVPVVTAFPTAEWTAEGAEILDSAPSVVEAVCEPAKLAGLTVVSQEMLDDSHGQAENIITQGLINDLARKIDEAAFGAPVSTLAPAGLRDLTGVQTVEAATIANLDPFATAQSKAEGVNANITAWVMHPDTLLALQVIKESTGSNRPLLGADITSPTGRSILGAPAFSSSFVEADVIWGVSRDAVHAVLRTPAELAVSRDAYFSSDSVGIRVTQRLGFVAPHEAGIVKIGPAAA